MHTFFPERRELKMFVTWWDVISPDQKFKVTHHSSGIWGDYVKGKFTALERNCTWCSRF